MTQRVKSFFLSVQAPQIDIQQENLEAFPLKTIWLKDIFHEKMKHTYSGGQNINTGKIWQVALSSAGNGTVYF